MWMDGWMDGQPCLQQSHSVVFSMLKSKVQELRNIETEQTYIFFVDLGYQISPNISES